MLMESPPNAPLTTSAQARPSLRPICLPGIDIPVPVLLAPMAGVTDAPFRRAVGRFGAGLTFSEMIASQAMIREVKKTLHMVQKAQESGPHCVQIAGGDPAVMAEAAKLSAGLGARLIDINFGCPVKKIVNGEAGAALMKDEDRAARIVDAVVRAVDVPVSVKMRLGWGADSLNAPSLARKAQDAGARMVTVHGRTRNQFYNGTADWAAIRAVKESVTIPVIANGDIQSCADMAEALALSGADGVMIGRGVYGRPWLLRDLMAFTTTGAAPAPLTRADVYDVLRAHFEDMIETYGPVTGLRLARKHMGWYSKGLPGAAEFRAAVNVTEALPQTRALIEAFWRPLTEKDET